ncbi:MAG: ATP-grasp domain-containing protein, partial [Candidatus Velthaea sp.]
KSFVAANPGSWVLKSQVMMGGRGKAGGIKFADDAAQGETLARELIGKVLKNVQNPDGEEVRSLLVEEKVAIASEAYVSITIDRAAKKPVVIVSSQGGMDVEEVAESHPEAIAKYWIDPAAGFSPYIARRLAFAANLPAGYHKAFPKVVAALYDL